jgi:protein-tyrosine sulfotransferase
MKIDDEKYHSARRLRLGFVLRRLLRCTTYDGALYADPHLAAGQVDHLHAVIGSAQKVFADRQLLWIFGVMPRSGTNFLYQMLMRLQPFAPSALDFVELPVLAGEDYFMGPLDLMGRIHPQNRSAFGRMEWMAYGVSGLRNRLLDSAEPGSVTVVKTPFLWQFELWPVLFPQDRAVLVLRDGRYVVDSFCRSFARKPLRRTFADVCLETADALRKALVAITTLPPEKLHVLRYEAAVQDRHACLAALMEWHGLPSTNLPQDELDSLPIYGSSVVSCSADGAVNWEPVAAGGYDPATRPLEWTAKQKRIFERICGPANAALGYPAV